MILGKRLCGFAILCLIATQVSAQEKVAILDFDGRGISVIEVETLTDVLRSEMVNTGVVTILERGAMQAILQEQDFQLSGCASDECAVEVGQLLGVSIMMAGSIGKIGATYSIVLRTIDVETGQVMSSLTSRYKGEIDGLLDTMGEIARDWVTDYQRSTGTLPPVTGTLSVQSLPIGGSVGIDGLLVGQTPLLNHEIQVGEHRIVVNLPGYAALDTTITVAENQAVSISAILQRVLVLFAVNTVPPGGRLAIGDTDGFADMGVTPAVEIRLLTGTYRFRIEREGYARVDSSVTISEVDTLLTFYLVPLPAQLAVTTMPYSAVVVMDGDTLGISPLDLMDVPAGIHTFQFYADNYLPTDTTINLAPGSSDSLQVVLAEVHGQLIVNTTPEGVLIIIDGDSVGTTPYDPIRLLPGVHTVNLSHPQYHTVDTLVTIDTAQTVALELPLAAITGQLAIGSTPEGAQVFIDGDSLGTTPIDWTAIIIGGHLFTLEKPGYIRFDTTLTVIEDSVETIAIALTPRGLGLALTTTPAGAAVRIDGVDIGITPIPDYILKPDRYSLLIEKAGYAPVDTGLTVLVGQPIRPFHFDLVQQFEPVDITGSLSAQVSIDGEPLGQLPVSGLRLSVGPHKIEAYQARHLPFSGELVVKVGERNRYNLVMQKKSRFAATAISVVVPGGGQFFNGETAKGASFLVSTAAVGAMALAQSLAYASADRGYIQAVKNYGTASDLGSLTGYRDIALTKHREAQTTLFLQNAYLAAALNVWLVNVLDASDTKYSPYIMSALLPGSGQIKQGKKWRGILFLAISAGSAGMAVITHERMLNASILYDQKMDIYRNAKQLTTAEQARETAEEQYSRVESLLKQRNLALQVAGTVWTLNLIEIWF